MKYTTDGNQVFAGKKVIAQAMVGPEGYSVRIRQGMDREKTIQKICEDCPDFAESNGIDVNYYPKLF